MAKQIRKFEQNAIAREILNNIVASRKITQKKAEKSNEFKPIKKVQKDLIDIQKAITKLENKRRVLRTKLNKTVENFNNTYKNSKLNWDSYNDNAYWNESTWDLQSNIERKLAIALIDPDWQEKLHDIINQITKELS